MAVDAALAREPRTGGLGADTVLDGLVVDVGGCAIHASASDAERARAVAGALRAARPSARPAAATIRFDSSAAPELDPRPDATIDVVRSGPELVVVSDGRGLVARVTPTEMVVSGDARDPVMAFRRIFATAIAHLLAWHDRQVLHAGALAADEGCLLVLGGTGMGKSTVALAALRSGWRVLGDDLVALRRSDGPVLAITMGRPLIVSAECSSDVEGLDGVPLGDVRGRLELPAATVTSATEPVIGVVASVHGRARHGALRELPAAQVVRLALESFPAAFDHDTLLSVFPLAVELARLPALVIAHGTRASTRVAEGARLLDEARARVVAAASPPATTGG
jgi:hypothetical protein